MFPNPIDEKRIDDLLVSIYSTDEEVGGAAAQEAAGAIQTAIQSEGDASIIIAAGISQLPFFRALIQNSAVNWSRVDIFHMDEYLGIDPAHPAGMAHFLRRNFVDYIKPRSFHPIASQVKDVEVECRRYEQMLRARRVALCMAGIGENGHLAFNDPPFADFDDPHWVKLVRLDDVSRKQQVKEGHLARMEEVPTHAITLTIPALISAAKVLALALGTRKTEIVATVLSGPISENCPASILRHVPQAHLFLDVASASNCPVR